MIQLSTKCSGLRQSGKIGLVNSTTTVLFLGVQLLWLSAQYFLTRYCSILRSSLPQSPLTSYCAHSFSFYSPLSRQQQSISSYEFRDVHRDMLKDAPAELQNIILLSTLATPPLTQNSWHYASCSRKVQLSGPVLQSRCPFAPSHRWCTIPATQDETSHFLAFPAAIHSSDNWTTLQLLILFIEWDIYKKRNASEI